MSLYLGLDLGTGSVKALLLDERGEVRRRSAAPYPVHAPRRGWAESDPEDWWNAAAQATREAVGGLGGEVSAVGLSGQMHGVVLCDAKGTPLRPAVLWADARSEGELKVYRDLDEDLKTRLANPPAVGMAGPSLLWLRDEEPESYHKARWVLQPKDWLRLRLTGEAAAEPSDASATLLYDLRSDGWSREVVEALGLRDDFLPPLRASAEVAGKLRRETARDLGLRAGTPVVTGAADAAAAILGGGLREPGEVQVSVGTGAQVLNLRPHFRPDPRRRTHLYRTAELEGFYSLAAVQNAGLALEWARGVLGASWREVYEEAFAVPPGSGGVTFLPYLSGERTPHFDPAARGAWSNLGLEHERGHLLRAALEGVAFAIREALEALEAAGTEVGDEVRDEVRDEVGGLRLAGGGVRDERWRRLLADALGRELGVLPASISDSASARGAAMLAGGEIPPPSPEIDRIVPFDPTVYEEPYLRYRELYPALRAGRE